MLSSSLNTWVWSAESDPGIVRRICDLTFINTSPVSTRPSGSTRLIQVKSKSSRTFLSCCLLCTSGSLCQFAPQLWPGRPGAAVALSFCLPLCGWVTLSQLHWGDLWRWHLQGSAFHFYGQLTCFHWSTYKSSLGEVRHYIYQGISKSCQEAGWIYTILRPYIWQSWFTQILLINLNFLTLWLLRNRASQSIKERVIHLLLLLAAVLLQHENWTASKTASELLYAIQKFLHIRCLQGMSISGQCVRPCSCEHLQDWATEKSQMTNPCLSLFVTAKCMDKTLGSAEAGSYAWVHQDSFKMCGRWFFLCRCRQSSGALLSALCMHEFRHCHDWKLRHVGCRQG